MSTAVEAHPEARATAPGVHRLRGLTTALVCVLLLNVVVNLGLGIHAFFDNLMLNDAIADPDSVSRDRLELSDQLTAVAAIARWLSFIVTAIIFLVWFGLAASNLGKWEIPRHGTAWSVISWFVPIMSWFTPKQATNDLWRAGDKQAQQPFFFDLWWAAWLVALLLTNAALRPTPADGDLPAFREVARLEMAASVANVVAGVLCVLVVRAVAERQNERADRPWRPPAPSPQEEWTPRGGTYYNLEDGWKP